MQESHKGSDTGAFLLEQTFFIEHILVAAFDYV